MRKSAADEPANRGGRPRLFPLAISPSRTARPSQATRRKNLEKHTHPGCACRLVRRTRGACAKQRDVHWTEQGLSEIRGRPERRAGVVQLRRAALSAVWNGKYRGSRATLPPAFRVRDRSDVVDRSPGRCDDHYARAARVQRADPAMFFKLPLPWR